MYPPGPPPRQHSDLYFLACSLVISNLIISNKILTFFKVYMVSIIFEHVCIYLLELG